ncbi:hypothetical protein FA95DRAFT_532406 [Auriscalpium vulgare]|uniref:Uncharacterized protein n=1 Tax=Auriscalpium vulgare TaxID=40419 RepID=A0ACB8RGM5_9AGAM|nr:hypothetical protein FA95DRAFT_532406 [Auriscalpium vulgare]
MYVCMGSLRPSRSPTHREARRTQRPGRHTTAALRSDARCAHPCHRHGLFLALKALGMPGAPEAEVFWTWRVGTGGEPAYRGPAADKVCSRARARGQRRGKTPGQLANAPRMSLHPPHWRAPMLLATTSHRFTYLHPPPRHELCSLTRARPLYDSALVY